MRFVDRLRKVSGKHATTLYKSSQLQLATAYRHNISTFRAQPLAEISGSFGDLGTLLPLMIALTDIGAISLPSTLIFSGLANIVTGFVFGLPVPVQPMKAIAAVAIAQHFTPEVNASAGLFVAACIGLLGVTGTIGWFTDRVPLPVVRGIQIGTGLSLVTSAGQLYRQSQANNLVLLLAFVGLLGVTASTPSRRSHALTRIPYALILLILALFAIWIQHLPQACQNDCSDPAPTLGFIAGLPIIHPSGKDFLRGTLAAGIGQLPLTTLNSIIAVSLLARDLYSPTTLSNASDRPSSSPASSSIIDTNHAVSNDGNSDSESVAPPVPTTTTTTTKPDLSLPPTALALSIATLNILALPFSAMPICHGSGGLAAQHKFGARSGSSIIFLGLLKLILGLVAGDLTAWIARSFPTPVLGLLMAAAGLELALVATNSAGVSGSGRGDEGERKRDWSVMLWTVAGILAFKNDALGFAAGMLAHVVYEMGEREGWRDLEGAYRKIKEGWASFAMAEGRVRLD